LVSTVSRGELLGCGKYHLKIRVIIVENHGHKTDFSVG